MELILISSSKLKIMLDEADMKQYNIGEETDCAQIATRKAIRTILDQARDKIGFNTEGSEIFVQLYTSKRGGCELFVTKSSMREAITDANASIHKSTEPISDKKVKKRSGESRDNIAECDLPSLYEGRKSKAHESEDNEMIFSFSSIGDMCAVCRRIRETCNIPESHAFKGPNGLFYLILVGVGSSAYSRLDSLTFIVEYGEREAYENSLMYVKEHCMLICKDNAIETLSEF